MTTILDCIERIPDVLERILEERERTLAGFDAYLTEHVSEIEEIWLVGSGTSGTASTTAQYLMEQASGLPVRVMCPNDIAEGRICAPRALYVFLSQTGNSKVVLEVMERLTRQGYLCVSLTEDPDTRLAQLSPCHICLNCGREEFGMRTIGYAASVLNLMLLGMETGLARGSLTLERFDALLRDAAMAPKGQRAVIPRAKDWFQKRKWQFFHSDCILFTGAGSLYGLALEGAVKLWEMPQVVSAGYELEEGMHGPNYGYNGRQCVVVLDSGGKESGKARQLAGYVKEVLHNGLLIGPEPMDDSDFALEAESGPFSVLEYTVAVQVMSYFLATDAGRDISRPLDHSEMDRYFKTHDK